LSQAFKRIVRRAKLVGVSLHTLRHSFATTANVLGYTESNVGALLGHAAHSVTRRYIHVVDKPLMQAADHVARAISDAMEGAPKKNSVADGSSSNSVHQLFIAA
jgi:hypothetical protein